MPSSVKPDPGSIVNIGELWIRTVNEKDLKPNHEFRSFLGDTAPVPTEGYGGWDIVARRRKRALTEWIGNSPLAMDVSYMIDAFGEEGGGQRVERALGELENMAGLRTGQPPLVWWYANALHDNRADPGRYWYIENLTIENPVSNQYGKVVRATGTITLREWQGDEYLAVVDPPGGDEKPKAKWIFSRKGDTLKKIAKRELHSSRRWHELRRMNVKKHPKLRDPNYVIPKHTHLRIH